MSDCIFLDVVWGVLQDIPSDTQRQAVWLRLSKSEAYRLARVAFVETGDKEGLAGAIRDELGLKKI